MEALFPAAPVIFLLAWFGWRIACRAGYSGLWGLTALVPPLGLLALWYLAASKDWGTGRADRPEAVRKSTTGKMTIRRPTEPARPKSSG